MGIFQDMVQVFNRAPEPITVRFDGQQIQIPPGASSIPAVVVPYAKNQNPVMGTQDYNNPGLSGAKYLIGVMNRKDNCAPLTADEWAAHKGQPCRINTDEMFADMLDSKERVRLVGKRKTFASAGEAVHAVEREFGDRF